MGSPAQLKIHSAIFGRACLQPLLTFPSPHLWPQFPAPSSIPDPLPTPDGASGEAPGLAGLWAPGNSSKLPLEKLHQWESLPSLDRGHVQAEKLTGNAAADYLWVDALLQKKSDFIPD